MLVRSDYINLRAVELVHFSTARKKKGIPFASKPSPIPGGALNPPGQQEKEGKESNTRNSFKEYQPRHRMPGP
jgi:hypothetical protein